MRIVWLALLLGLLTGCGSSGGVSGNAVDPGPDPEPTATTARVTVTAQAESLETVMYGVEFELRLPHGVTVAADPLSGAVLAGSIRFADSRAFTGARYHPATASAPAWIEGLVADPGGFTVGDLATLTCNVAAGVSVSAGSFPLPVFIVKDQNGQAMSAVTPRVSVQTQ